MKGWKKFLLFLFSIFLFVAEIYCFSFFLARQFFVPQADSLRSYIRSVFKIDPVNFAQFLLAGTIIILVAVFCAMIIVRFYNKKNGQKSYLKAVLWISLSLSPLVLLPLTLFFPVADGRSVLSSAIITVCFILFVLKFSAKESEKSDLYYRENKISRWHMEKILPAIISILSGLFYLTICILRHRSHWSSLIDLGLFFEIYHNAEGKFLYAPSIGQNFFGEHFSPILVLLWPVMKVFPSPVTLIVIQSASIALGGYFLFMWANSRLKSISLSSAFMLAYLFNPYIQQSAFYDFHIDMLEPPMIFGAMLALERGNRFFLWLCCIFLWCTKEDTFIYTCAISIYGMIIHKRLAQEALLFT